MLSKKFAAVLVILVAAFSMVGSPLTGFALVGDEARGVVANSSISESTSLVLFGCGLWAIAMLRRSRAENQGA